MQGPFLSLGRSVEHPVCALVVVPGDHRRKSSKGFQQKLRCTHAKLLPKPCTMLNAGFHDPRLMSCSGTMRQMCHELYCTVLNNTELQSPAVYTKLYDPTAYHTLLCCTVAHVTKLDDPIAYSTVKGFMYSRMVYTWAFKS